MIFASPIYWFDMTAQLKTVIDRMYAGGSTGFHFHKTALLLDAGADHVFDAAISQYKAMTSYLKWEDLGIICVPNMEDKGSMRGFKVMKKVAFICVHNSCRSQIAEALGKHFASDVFESYSAGSEIKNQINPDAVRLMKKLYGIDMEKTQHPKLINEIPQVDLLISMGCNVGCPYVGREFDDNWQLDDSTGKDDQEFIKVIYEIEEKILKLKEELME